jgi:signal transduction histidine kinase
MNETLRPAPLTPLRPASFWRLQLAGWAAFGVAMAGSRIGRFPLSYMIATKFALAFFGLLATLLLWPIYRRVLGRALPLPALIALCAVLSYVVASIWTAAYNLLDTGVIMPAMLGRAPQLRRVSDLFGGSVYHAFVLFGWSALYLSIKHSEALQQAREQALRAETLAQAARLEALRYQLNPHFLFNTLNAVSSLVVDGRTEDAARMISRLSDFLRTTLDSTAAEVSFTEELDVARRYLEIEQVRFGDRLTATFDVDYDAGYALVPSFLLQPLVENAVHHAVARSTDGGRIEISARRRDDELEIVVADDGPGLDAGDARSNGSGIGLANTRARLAQLYGDAQRLVVEARPGGGVLARIALPFRRAA